MKHNVVQVLAARRSELRLMHVQRIFYSAHPSFRCSLCASANVTSPTRVRCSFSSCVTHTHTHTHTHSITVLPTSSSWRVDSCGPLRQVTTLHNVHVPLHSATFVSSWMEFPRRHAVSMYYQHQQMICIPYAQFSLLILFCNTTQYAPHTHTHTNTHDCFTALLDFVQCIICYLLLSLHDKTMLTRRHRERGLCKQKSVQSQQLCPAAVIGW